MLHTRTRSCGVFVLFRSGRSGKQTPQLVDSIHEVATQLVDSTHDVDPQLVDSTHDVDGSCCVLFIVQDGTGSVLIEHRRVVY